MDDQKVLVYYFSFSFSSWTFFSDEQRNPESYDWQFFKRIFITLDYLNKAKLALLEVSKKKLQGSLAENKNAMETH